MSNTHLNISMIAKEALMELKNQLVFAKNANVQYSDEFAKKGAKIGNVINIRKPHKFEVSDGATLNLQNTTDQTVPLTLDKRKHVAFQFSSQELTLNVDEFRKRYIAPAITALANDVDKNGLALAKTSVWNSVGTPGTAPSTSAAALTLALQAGQKLDENACPSGDRSMVVNPAAQVSFVGGLAGLFNPQKELSDQFLKGKIGKAAGFDWMMGQNVASHTTGAMGGAPAVKTTITAQGATSFDIDGASATVAGFLKAGDVITIEGVYAVNPITKEALPTLQQFVVQADVDVSGSEGTVTVLPGMYSSGPYQNVSALPVDGGLVKQFGHATSYAGKTTACNVAFHKDAFGFGFADLELPGGVDMAARATDPESGLSLRIVRQYDINNDVWPCRIDILYGVKALYPELACRVHI